MIILTSSLTASTLSACLLKMCFLTNSAARNFFPLKGHSHLSFPSSCMLALMKFSTSVSTYVKVKTFHLLSTKPNQAYTYNLINSNFQNSFQMTYTYNCHVVHSTNFMLVMACSYVRKLLHTIKSVILCKLGN